MKKKELLRNIEKNKVTITRILATRPDLWMRYNQWVKNQLGKENECLFPKDKKYLLYSSDNTMRRCCTRPAFDYINHNLTQQIDDIRTRAIHRLISAGSSVVGGATRMRPVNLENLNIDAPASPDLIRQKMYYVYERLTDDSIPMIDMAIQTHYSLLAIQPFEDLNKRTARTVMNWLLLRNGYTPILFNHKGDRDRYISAIKNKARNERYEDIFLNTMLRTQEDVLIILGKSH